MIGYPYPYPFPNYSLERGWYSGLAQAEIAMALIRYYSINKDDNIYALIQGIIDFMLLPTESGGLKTVIPEGYIWIEEYPSTPSSYVLNGFITIIFCIYEYSTLINQNEYYKGIYEECLISLKNSLHFYMENNWLKYDRYSKRINYCNFHMLVFSSNKS